MRWVGGGKKVGRSWRRGTTATRQRKKHAESASSALNNGRCNLAGTVGKQVAFLDSLDFEELEELLLLDAPIGFKAPDEVESVAAEMLGKMSENVRRTIDMRDQPDDAVLCLTGQSAGDSSAPLTAGGCGTIDAAAAGFDASQVPSVVRLDTQPPGRDVLDFESAGGGVLKGREIMYHFNKGWFRGRILKQASDAKIKSSGRVCNYRVFFEADDELLNMALYEESYGAGAVAAVDGWMLLSEGCYSLGERIGQGGGGAPLALMPPGGGMDALAALVDVVARPVV